MLRPILHLYRDAYAGLPRPVSLLSMVAFIHRSGTMVEPFLILYLTQELGYSAGEAGGFLAVMGLGNLTGSYLGGMWTERWGARKVQAVSLVLAGGFLFAVVGVTETWLLTLFLLGFSVSTNAFRPANAVATSAWIEPELRSRAFGLLRLAINVGMTFGPAVGGFLALVDYRWLFWVDGATCLLAAMFLLLWVPRSRDDEPASARSPESEPREPPRSVWRDVPFVAFLGLLLALCIALLQIVSTFPLTLREVYGLTEDRIGLLFAVNTAWIIAFEMVLLHKVRPIPELKVMSAGAVLIGLGLGLMPFGTTFLFAAVSVTVWSFGEMLTFPVAQTLTANRPGRGHPGRHMGAFTATIGLAFMGAQALGPWVYEVYGYTVLWIGCAVVGALTAVGFWMLAGRWEAN